MKRQNVSTQGFTLVELMVVVAIIGILAAIAIPNFQRYQAKAKQSEAKIALSGIYTAERAYQVEKSGYTTCLNSIGVGVEGANSFYTIGFGSAITANNCNSWDPVQTPPPICNHLPNVTYFVAARPAAGAAVVGDIPATACNTTTFTAGAAGNIGGRCAVGSVGAGAPSVADRDQWTINEQRQLTNTAPCL